MSNTKIICGLLLVLLIGCSPKPAPIPTSGSAIIIGKQRPSIAVEEVRVYDSYPEIYEVIAIVKSKAAEPSSLEGVGNKVLDELKVQAAKVGANGIVLKGLGKTSIQNESYETLSADAIYVE
jgi:ASC-1-like (ASCH) protein